MSLALRRRSSLSAWQHVETVREKSAEAVVAAGWARRMAYVQKTEPRPKTPWRPGQDSQLGQESAKRLQALSVNLRRYMRESVPDKNDPRPDPDKLKAAMTGATTLEWNQ